MYRQHTLEFNSVLNDCREMFCEVSGAAAKTNSILKWVKVRNCLYKTNIVKIHTGIHCWLLGEEQGISSPSNKYIILVTDVVHLESKLLCVPEISVQNNFMRNVICSKYQSWFKTIRHWLWSDKHTDVKLKQSPLKFLETAQKQEQSLSLLEKTASWHKTCLEGKGFPLPQTS